NSDLSEEKVKGALRRCPVPRGYTQRLEPPFLRVAATGKDMEKEDAGTISAPSLKFQPRDTILT
ncbi:hypothetical protein ACTQ56_13355, partial [[Clostridium] aminophilum]|uniref:hypothetical protein n=1 Tax=[Clostridium] aminophilum TaxID=1526 RepID=UPI003F981094